MGASPGKTRVSLVADCPSCFGLCCVALAFRASTDFAIDKEVGQPCPNLQSDLRCGIHNDLRQQGFSGCSAYDCFGAGQRVSQLTFAGNDWRQNTKTAAAMFEVFPVMRALHELLGYLIEALTLQPDRGLHAEISVAIDKTESLTYGSPDALLQLDVAPHRADVSELLLRASELVRATGRRPRLDRSGADLIGANLCGADLRGANLRGAYLIAANLRGADLRLADLLGADVRDADLGGADLTTSFFLTQAQLNAAKGDTATKLKPSLPRPSHWQSA